MSAPPTSLSSLPKAIQAYAGLLMDAVLSPAPDEENAEAIAR